jgi:hypothetical protein
MVQKTANYRAAKANLARTSSEIRLKLASVSGLIAAQFLILLLLLA